MKTKKAMKDYECYECKKVIKKGTQYASKTVTLGYMTSWVHDTPVPPWSYEPYRSAMPMCEKCIDKKNNNKKGRK